MKKIILTALIILSTAIAYARDFTYTYEGQTITYTVIDEVAKTCKTKEGSSSSGWGNSVYGELKLPEHPKDGDSEFTLTEIGKQSFFTSDLTGSLVIPNTVKKIGEKAFWNCFGFTDSLIIGDGVTEIGAEAFYTCGFKNTIIIGS